MKKAALALALGLSASGVRAAADDRQDNVFSLGAVQVTATALGDESPQAVSLSAADIRTHDKETVGGALNLMSGVSISKVGARNEEMVYVRGFDLRQVPVFVDGIPVYVPYDGYADLGRFNTFDIARIDVAKGFSSLIYGPNTLGGAINLISRRPQKEFEGEVGIGSTWTRDGDNNNNRVYANVGTHQGLWYLQAGASYLKSSYFPLPDSFDATAAEEGGHRNNSDNTDRKYNLKLVLTPNETDEYSLNYISQHGVKGNPPYAGTVPGVTARYWQWPYWDKDSLYYISSTQFGIATLKLRAYHDTYENSLFAYDNATYTTQNRPSSFQSWYDDYTDGASIEGDFQLGERNLLKAAYHWKSDVHREHDRGEPIQHFKDRTQSIAIEDTFDLTSELSIVGGFSHDSRDSQRAEDYNTTSRVISDFAQGDNSANNGTLGLFWKSPDIGSVYLTAARKTRFATIKDRFSYRMGTALPNPDLNSERANHFELGYENNLSQNWQWDAAIFYSYVRDLIQSVSIANSLCATPPCSQMQNIGKARVQGFDGGLRGDFKAWKFGVSYSYLSRKNLDDSSVHLTDTPRHKIVGDIAWYPISVWSVTATAEASSSRYTTTNGLQQTSGFGIANLKTGYRLFDEKLLIEAGVHNVFDRLYEYSEGFPEAGRTIFAQANYAF